MYASKAVIAILLFAASGVRSNPVGYVVPHDLGKSADLLIATAALPCIPASPLLTKPGRVYQRTAETINASWVYGNSFETRHVVTTLVPQLELRTASVFSTELLPLDIKL